MWVGRKTPITAYFMLERGSDLDAETYQYLFDQISH